MHLINLTTKKTAPVKKRADGAFIVKMQRSMPPGPVMCLIYNSDRSVEYQTGDKIALDLMGPSKKMFFWAKLTPDNKIEFQEEAPWQDW